MNQIEKLIEELCPNGVEYKTLDAVLLKTSKINWREQSAPRRYIDLSSVDKTKKTIQETTQVDAKTAPSRARQIVKHNDVLFATTRPAQQRWTIVSKEFDNQVASTGFAVLRVDNNQIIPSYLAHNLGTQAFLKFIENNQTLGNYPSISEKKLKMFRFPLPPLEVQAEIVKILDTFQSLEAELEAELEARKKQYEFYRDQLLTFTERERESGGQH